MFKLATCIYHSGIFEPDLELLNRTVATSNRVRHMEIATDNIFQMTLVSQIGRF